MIFKPRKQQIHVPGFGVVQKEDFTQEHFNILMTRAADGKRDEFIKQYFECISYGDQPLFAGEEPEAKKPKSKSKKESPEKAKKEEDDADEAELLALIEAEEKSKNVKEEQ